MNGPDLTEALGASGESARASPSGAAAARRAPRSWDRRRTTAPSTPAQWGGVGRPHLLHVFPSFSIGGAQMRFAGIVEGLGHRFSHTVVSLSGDYGAADLLPAGAGVRFLEPPARGGSLLAQLGLYGEMLAQIAPDALLTYNWGSIEVALANVFRRTPHIHHEDGFGPEEAHRQFRRRVWMRRLALRRSEVVVPSQTLQRLATGAWGLDPRRVHYVPNAIAPRAHHPRSLADLGLQLPDHLPRIIWVGALRPEKNPLRVLRAFAPLKDRAVLLVVGGGPEACAIRQEAARLGLGPSLRLLGRRTDTRDLLMHCQVLALSSDTEQMPFVVLEAMDAGLPIAASDVGDIRQMVAEPNRPFIVPASDAELTRALQALIGDPALRAALGAANAERLRQAYSLPGMLQAYGALLERAVEPTRRGRLLAPAG